MSSERRDCRESSGATPDHGWDDRIEEIHRAEDVDAHHLLRVGEVELRRMRRHAHSGVRDREIERTAETLRCADDGVANGAVEGDGQRGGILIDRRTKAYVKK